MSRLLPDEGKFFDHFNGIAMRLTTAAALLEEGLDDPALMPALAARIDRIQHATDESAYDIDANVDDLLVPPLDREDIHLLSTKLALLADFIDGIARRAVSLETTVRREPAVALARILLRALREIEAAVKNIRTGDGVLARCQEIKRAEEAGDAAWEAAVAELLTGDPDPVEVIRWKALYDQLEDTLDACVDVADELETIAVKHE